MLIVTIATVLQQSENNWLFMLIIGLIGGFGLFLFGMYIMSEALQKAAGDKMRSILGKLTHNRVLAMGVGAFITVIIQSSSATSVMLISFVQSGLMRYARTIAVLLGASIGTTVTVQLIAFRFAEYSLLLIGIGAGILFFARSVRLKNIGLVILGFGILFFGMYVMSEAMSPLRSYQPFLNLLLQLKNPIYGIITGALFTVLIQSSGTAIGIFIVLATQGLLNLETSIPLILGANLGTTITGILASINTNREAKKVAYTFTMVKVIGILLMIGWLPYFSDIVARISPGIPTSNAVIASFAEIVPRQIANAHTLFNIILVIIILPFTGLIAKGVDKILPRKIIKEDILTTVYLDKKLIPTPALAL
ncbi:MAG: Na/Pi cotransporter family protein, partial [Bacteroidia bacterium]|nr:Na/Pi cotransporter family protein [Bacteroidia bacterium]